MTTEIKQKRLTKIRLINWHYFSDETITIKGSVLFTGENASGKSTILDAIQLVLTTNSTRFNPAANEKSKRDLKGYVRCKTGTEGSVYVRSTGPVISYVALEFYEETKERYFVIGVKLDSSDLEADIAKKWFCVEGRLETISFIVGHRPAMDKEFTQNGKKIQFESQVGRAGDMFRVRLGRLEETFKSMVIKSMAFKPMDKVKDFINQFILPENNIETDVLRENIRNLQELHKLIDDVKLQIAQLHGILEQAEQVAGIDNNILVTDILMAIATLESRKQDLEQVQRQLSGDEVTLSTLNKTILLKEEEQLRAEQNKTEIGIALASNECGRLIETLKEKRRTLLADKARSELAANQLHVQIKKISDAAAAIGFRDSSITTCSSQAAPTEERAAALESVRTAFKSEQNTLYSENAAIGNSINELDAAISDLTYRIEQLQKNRPVYDDNTMKLLNAVREEFKARKLDTEPRIFADLLEIELPEWRNAVEGYLNTQRMNIIVEPQYYDIAAEVYDRLKSRIHSVGLVNTDKLMRNPPEVKAMSLSEAVSSQNRYARAYADYLLGRVIRCDTVDELKSHNIAITRGCMKYQGHVLSKIREDIYKVPYIGREALQIQLGHAKKERAAKSTQREQKLVSFKENRQKIALLESCNFDMAIADIASEQILAETCRQLHQTELDLKEAEANPTLKELTAKLRAAELTLLSVKREADGLKEKITNKKRDIEEGKKRITELGEAVAYAQKEYDSAAFGHDAETEKAQGLYNKRVKSKSASAIAENYVSRKKALENQRDAAFKILIELQVKYKNGDFGTGMETLPVYTDDLNKLERADLVSYEDKLASAQESCELEFRENFLAKLRENIEHAHTIFSRLNKSLKDVYYGEDSYKFKLSANREREALHDMITSAVDLGSNSLFSSVFEEKYHTEMDELFAKLTDDNSADTTSVKELTDYRSYLDYDIQIVSRNGNTQLFSKTYGEKSGGETQTPYYVAIAASFAQIYSGRETCRILMLDEAFNNMDEDRIESMMKFFRSPAMDFQVILAAPPSRMETIGEYVDSIHLTIRRGTNSIIEEYYV